MSQINVVKRAVYREQLATLKVLDELVELERKREYLSKGYNSLYTFLTEKLKYSEGSAMRRIHGARVIARYPHVRELLRTREVSLCTVSLIAKEALKCREKGLELIQSIRGKSKREVEGMLLSRGGKAPMKEQIRVIHMAAKQPSVIASEARQSPQATLARNDIVSSPPPEELYRVSFTTTKEVFEVVKELQAGMAHSFGGKRATIAELFERGVRSLKADIDKKRTPRNKATATSLARAKVEIATKKNSRYITTETRRRVFGRDHSKCQYVYEDGSKCCSTWGLEIDHVKAHSLGGKSDAPNLRVTCRAHNQHLARESGLL